MAALVGLMGGVVDSASAKANTSDAAQVRVIGESRSAPRVDQAGHGVPLRHALEQIVPASYSINLPNAGAWADVPVSWHARVPFVVALREALAGAPGVTADVDLKLHLVTVSASASASTNSSLSASSSASSSVSSNAAATTNASAAPASVAQQMGGAPSKTVTAPAQPTVEAPTLLTQPPLLVAMRSEPPVAAATQPATTAPVASVAATPRAATAPAAIEPSTDAAGDPLPAPPPPEPVRAWHLSVSDHTVKAALARWAKEDGWQLVWDVPIDFGVDADATVHGTFEQALQAVVDALKKSETPIQAVMYRGNKVLRIVAKGAA
jgi:hypothetical protein